MSLVLTLLLAPPLAERRYTVTSFERIRLEAPIAVTIATDRAPRAVLRGPRAIIDRLVVRNEGRTLIVQLPGRNQGSGGGDDDAPATLELATPTLDQALLTGDGTLAVDRVRGLGLTLGISGSGAIEVGGLDVERLQARVAGPGSLMLGGRAAALRLEVEGAARVDGTALAVRDAKMIVTGAAQAQLRVTNSAEVTARGAAKVTLDGRPACVLRVTGSARVAGCAQTSSSAASRP